LGRFAESIAAFDAAVAVSPRESFLMTTRAETLWYMRRTSEAEAGFRRALALDPDNIQATLFLSNLRLYRQGDTAGAWAVLQGDRPEIVLQRVNVLAFQRKYADALRLLAPIPDSMVTYNASDYPKSYLSGRLYFAAGQRAQAEPLLRQAKAELEARLGSLPGNYSNGQSIRFALADVEAMLGNDATAIQTARQALALLPIEKDSINGTTDLALAAQVYARLGRADLVVPAVARLRSLPYAGDAIISASTLKLDPVWDKVRADPGFQAEIAAYAKLDQP
jgi:tetratricopeptide (TPR) repeat protein